MPSLLLPDPDPCDASRPVPATNPGPATVTMRSSSLGGSTGYLCACLTCAVDNYDPKRYSYSDPALASDGRPTSRDHVSREVDAPLPLLVDEAPGFPGETNTDMIVAPLSSVNTTSTDPRLHSSLTLIITPCNPSPGTGHAPPALAIDESAAGRMWTSLEHSGALSEESREGDIYSRAEADEPQDDQTYYGSE